MILNHGEMNGVQYLSPKMVDLSNYKVDPAEGLVIVFMINQLPNRTDIASKFPTLVYQALVTPRAGADRAER